MMEIIPRIAREASDSAYRWDSDRVGKTYIVDDGISVDKD